nr:MAG TPA: hypothetical protein [Caudoviricetes sp.]
MIVTVSCVFLKKLHTCKERYAIKRISFLHLANLPLPAVHPQSKRAIIVR